MVKENRKIMPADGFDAERLAEQVRLAIGGRTLSSFAETAGVSKSYISKIVNNNLPAGKPPSRKMLIKITDPETAVPENGVTASDLFISCGYSTEELEKMQDKKETNWMLQAGSVVQKHYSNLLPMTAASILMNGLALNGMGQSMNVEVKDRYFKISIPENPRKYIGIPAFCTKKEAFTLIYATVLSSVLVLSSMRTDTTFYVLTDDEEFYEYLAEHLKVPEDMYLEVLYVKDQFIVSEEKIGENKSEWLPATIVTAPNTIRQLNKKTAF